MNNYLQKNSQGVIINLRLMPKSGKNEVVGLMADGRLKIRLQAPPVDNKANLALIDFLAKISGCKKNQIEIIVGLSSKNKTILFKGCQLDEIKRQLNATICSTNSALT